MIICGFYKISMGHLSTKHTKKKDYIYTILADRTNCDFKKMFYFSTHLIDKHYPLLCNALWHLYNAITVFPSSATAFSVPSSKAQTSRLNCTVLWSLPDLYCMCQCIRSSLPLQLLRPVGAATMIVLLVHIQSNKV